MNRITTATLLFSVFALLSGCATYKPKNLDDACSILKGKRSWYKASAKAAKKWGTPIATQLAIIHQESGFNAKARPPRGKFLWVFPGKRKSDAYGYPQAKNATWRWYKEKTGARGAKRHNFSDAVHFIGWYNKQSQKIAGIGLGDPYNQYLAYHEGHGGYKKGSYRNKRWLKKVAKKVAVRAGRYQKQIKSCQKSLRKRRWGLF